MWWILPNLSNVLKLIYTPSNCTTSSPKAKLLLPIGTNRGSTVCCSCDNVVYTNKGQWTETKKKKSAHTYSDHFLRSPHLWIINRQITQFIIIIISSDQFVAHNKYSTHNHPPCTTPLVTITSHTSKLPKISLISLLALAWSIRWTGESKSDAHKVQSIHISLLQHESRF